MRIRTYLAILAIFAATGFAGGLQVRQPPKVVTKEVFVETQVPVCAPLLVPQKQAKVYRREVMKLAAAIPASALGRTK